MSTYTSLRGRGRGRARGSFGAQTSYHHSPPLPGDRRILDGLSSTPLQTISIASPQTSDKEVKITDLKYIGSYNWLDKPSPTIIVPGMDLPFRQLYTSDREPGSPPRWANKAPPYQVHPDDGIVFKDQNGYRCPTSVLLPLITAVDKTSKVNNEDFDWTAIDFVTDRNNLRKLLRWIGGNAPNEFRIDMQLAGKTVLFNRWENRYREQMSGFSYGFNFEKESTTPAPGCESSTGHHRIVRYVRSMLYDSWNNLPITRIVVESQWTSHGRPL